MSRIGKNPIKIEDGVEVSINGREVSAKGKLGESKITLPEYLSIKNEDGVITIENNGEGIKPNAMHGTYRMLVANLFEGVSNGFYKKLEISGVGYRVKKEGESIVLSLGWNHPVKMDPPEGITFEVPDEVTIIVRGTDKQFVGEISAKIRELRKPEPYKGKGIKYEGEYVRRKSAKSEKTEK